MRYRVNYTTITFITWEVLLHSFHLRYWFSISSPWTGRQVVEYGIEPEAIYNDGQYIIAINQEMIDEREKAIGYKLPKPYIHLLKSQNGGLPKNTNFPTEESASWAEDHIALTSIFGCDSTKMYSLCGEIGGEFMKEQWEYPDIGVYICDCPSGGHDMIALDYRECGKEGEPSVVHVDQDNDFRITFLAADFETFIRGLLNDEVFDTSAEDLERALEMIAKGSFSNLLQSLIDAQ